MTHADTTIRQLGAADAAAFKALRLRGLLECPTAFASSHDEEVHQPVAALAARLEADAKGAAGVYGAFAPDGQLMAVAGLARETMVKLSHKAVLWGMYVAPEWRRRGVAQVLVAHLLARAAAEPGLRQVTLGVHAQNEPALALYRSLGFVAWGTEPAAAYVDGEPQDETWMVCRLPGGPSAG